MFFLILKLKVLIFQSFKTNELRISPFCIDKNGNKFWYFGDTYLFLEVNENNKFKSKSKKSKSTNTDATNTSLFTGNCFYLVCQTSEDWNRLIEAYNSKNETATFSKLSKTFEYVSLLEKQVFFYLF